MCKGTEAQLHRLHNAAIVLTSPGLRDVYRASFRAHMPCRSLALLIVLVPMAWTAADVVCAQSKAVPSAPVPIDPLVAIVDADPLELSRVAQRLGDRAVIERLAPKHKVEVRLAAIRAVPYLRAPELALSALTPIVIARDGVLAQAAARAVWSIVGALSHDTLESRETLAVDLTQVTREVTRIASLTSLRADLRAQLNAAAAMLAGMGFSATD